MYYIFNHKCGTVSSVPRDKETSKQCPSFHQIRRGIAEAAEIHIGWLRCHADFVDIWISGAMAPRNTNGSCKDNQIQCAA